MEYDLLKVQLQKEVPVLLREVRLLYRELDEKYGLRAALVPVNFGFSREVLGSYTRASSEKEEGFFFSLFFVGRGMPKPLSQEDRKDLYLHEYAHYMQYHMDIPREYRFEQGIHGSAWRYCCSLVGAAPTPYYRVGESLRKHDYGRALRDPMKDKRAGEKDIARRLKEAEDKKNSLVSYEIGEKVEHPKFGEGIVEAAEPLEGSVRLKIRFGEEVKTIDQKWLLRSRYK